jgi:hypothetical protein
MPEYLQRLLSTSGQQPSGFSQTWKSFRLKVMVLHGEFSGIKQAINQLDARNVPDLNFNRFSSSSDQIFDPHKISERMLT